MDTSCTTFLPDESFLMNALPRPSRIRNAAFARWGLLVLALTLAASGQAVSGEDPPRVARPNLVLVLCDNLGYGDIEPFAAETVHRTPQLSRMASEGRRFTHFYASAGVCTPSRASIMTGCYAQRVGLHSLPDDGPVLRPVSPWGLHDAEVTLPEILREAGYATALIGKWHLGDQPEFLPVRHGFQSWFGIPYSEDMTRRSWKGRQWPPLPLMEGGQVVEAPADRTTLTQRYTDRAVRFIRQHRERPYFLMLSHAMPGSTPTPYASAAFQGKSRNGPWGDAVEELDWSTGKLLQAIRESTAERDTIVIWTSDNGAPTNGQDSRRGSNAPLRGRGYTTAEGGMRVPMLAWCPGRIPAGTTCDQLATTMDLLPTFAGLLTVTMCELCCLAIRGRGVPAARFSITRASSCRPSAAIGGSWNCHCETPCGTTSFARGPHR